MAMTLTRYVHPVSKTHLVRDDAGNLYEEGKASVAFSPVDGTTYDFVSTGTLGVEKQFYDETYKEADAVAMSVSTCEELWCLEPGFRELLESIGDLSKKRVLLLGNGVSQKEFYFLKLGAMCTYTDISITAIMQAKERFSRSEFPCEKLEAIEFHAADACHLPFADERFDVIYGCAFVHHIQDLNALFTEIVRCLKPEGICRFLDHAYSPLWQFAKKTFLRPLQRHTHRRSGISPADLLATDRGGYKRCEVELLKERFNFRDMLYLRVAFFEQLLQRGTCKLGGRPLRRLKPLLRMVDGFLDRTIGLVHKHGIVLVWGFTKNQRVNASAAYGTYTGPD